jgi:hypothetical protein
VQVLGWKFGGTRTWLLFPREKPEYQVVLLHVTGAEAEDTRAGFFGGEAQVFTLAAQGRELPAVHATGGESEFERDAGWRNVVVNELAKGPCLRLDLSRPGSPDLLLFQWTDRHGDEPVDEEQVLRFLEPFDLEGVR